MDSSSPTPTPTPTTTPTPTPNPTTNLQIVVSDVFSKSNEDPSVDQGEQSSESATVAKDPQPQAADTANYNLIIPEHEREYGCRYCSKKFSNKQALGGHQNAHKVERSMEKNIQESNNMSYFGPTHHGRMNMVAAAAAAAPYVSPYHRPHGYDFLHRSMYGCGGGGAVPYHSRQAAAAAGGGYNGGYYGGWSGHRMPGPYGGRAHYAMQPAQQNMNIRLPNFGPGSSNTAYFHHQMQMQGRPGFPGVGMGPSSSVNNRPCPNLVVNLRNVPAPQLDDEAYVDLSLKL